MVNQGDRFIAKSLVPGIPAITIIFKGIQETGFAEFPPFAMYDLTTDLPGHPKDSTVSRDTLEECGFVLPQEAP